MRDLAMRRIVAPGVAWTVLTPAAFGQSKLDAGVERTLSEIGNTRVLVVMTAPKLGEASSAAFREPDGFVADLLGDRGRNAQRIVDLPVVVVETDRRGIYDLVDNPHVAYVTADEPAPPLLETSLRTLRVDEVHATDVLGHGYSVAVLDTGVDYDHPFFDGKLRAEGCFSTVTSDVYSVTSLCGNGLDVDLTEGAGRNCGLPGCDHGTRSAIPRGRYGRNTGTSMAAAHVAGLFALLRSRVPSASVDGIESAVRATARPTTDPRTGLVLHFPDAREALDALARSGEQAEPGAGEWSSEDADAAFLAGIAGARRIVVQGGARATAMPASELADRIASALGSDVTVRSLGESTFVAESRTGFGAESLSRLLVELGPDTRLYRDDPVGPSAVR